jgi:glyceraldehyde-3-phosphate dehydrogenase (NAD(P))|tara:strand:+ start:362 stop:1441 length:1080 start_codon:yes stop_codon:yes gene_type:complete
VAKNILVIGTGTIGEPLIGLLGRLKKKLGIDELVFHKRTPLVYEIAKVNSLVARGAQLAVDDERWDGFKDIGHWPRWKFSEALQRADVVIDCTPAGNENKDKFYKDLARLSGGGKTFIAQGSEKNFGAPYAWGVNDASLLKAKHQFIQVVSCNTHAISRILLSLTKNDESKIISSDFVCIRRANDASQNAGFIPAPTAGMHSDSTHGTHHARDVSDLFQTRSSYEVPIFSSALKVNSQYMHVVRFAVTIKEGVDRAEVLERFAADEYTTTTHHESSNRVFSFGRDHGFYGRIYNHAVVCLPSITTVNHSPTMTTVYGFVFTPQDGNSLLSSVAAGMYGLHGVTYSQKLSSIKEFLIDEV